jgi:hypothetical protein
MIQSHSTGLLLRLGDWHAFSVQLAEELAAAGHAELARRLESGADEALLELAEQLGRQPNRAGYARSEA